MRIENTTEQKKDFYLKPKADHLAPELFEFPPRYENQNGVAEVPASVVKAMGEDPVARAWFESGHLVEARGAVPAVPSVDEDTKVGKGK